MNQWLKIGDLKHKLATSENMKRLGQIQKSSESQGHGKRAIDLEAHHVTMTASRARTPPEAHLVNW